MAFAGADAGQPPTPCATLPEGSTFPRARRRPYAVQGDPAQATALAAPSWVRGGANGHQPAGPALPASGTAAIAPRLQHGSTMRQHSTAVSPPTDNVGSRSSTPLAADESGYVPPRPARRGQRRCRLGPRCDGRSLGRLPDCAFVTSVARLARRRTARADHRRLERSRAQRDGRRRRRCRSRRLRAVRRWRPRRSGSHRAGRVSACSPPPGEQAESQDILVEAR
jgi:hypothetical protein